MSLISGVYSGLTDQQPFDKHPTVVVLEIEGSNECLVIPAFTHGRETIEKLIQAYESDGVSRDALVVEMNNRLSINWSVKYSAKEHVYWSIMQIDRIDRSLIKQNKPIGTMKPEYMLQLYRGVLAYMQSKPGQGFFQTMSKRKSGSK